MRPVGVPTSGNSKYVLVVVVLVVGIAALVGWKTCGNHQPTNPVALVSTYDASPLSHDESNLPLPPPIEEPVPEAGVRIITLADPCSARSCSGTATPELETALAFRAKQAHRCYDTALAQDTTLKGHITIAVRVASNGRVCSSNVADNDMGTASVANCVAGTFGRSGGFPAPKGNCVDVKVPISFIPGGK
jgi:hypothetical protein